MGERPRGQKLRAGRSSLAVRDDGGDNHMHKVISISLAAASLLALSACRQTPVAGNEAGYAAETNASATATATGIDGTWKADIDSVQFDQKPDELLLQAGQYTCKSCVPSVTVPADGAFHPVNTPYADS